MKKTIKWMLLFFCLIAVMAGCKRTQEETNVIIPISSVLDEVTEEPAVTIEPVQVTDDHKGESQSSLTGEWVQEQITQKRPYAIMINNIKAANPQSGTSQAAILYEALAEGGITRMMGIFEDFDSERIGSVRSARHYFVSFADEYDAIFVHYGQTKYATAKIEELGVDNLSGLTGIGTTVFFRDNTIKAPHNAFASYSGIVEGTEKLGYRTNLRENVNTFSFYDKDTIVDGIGADKVTLGFSSYTQPYFVYKEKTGLYYRYQFGSPHIDKATGKQLSFKNIIIQLVEEQDIDKNGYQTMDIENASGKGYYITNGKAMEITWVKNESEKTRTYLDANGTKLEMNIGKTYIGVYPTSRISSLSIL